MSMREIGTFTTPNASKYLQQLCKHFAHKVDVEYDETRGKALSLYMIVQTAGISIAQYILTLGDVSGFILFIIPSVLVSMAFAPILLSVSPAPIFTTPKPGFFPDFFISARQL